MIGDYGRETSVFGTSKGYDGVRFYSGRPITAADLNEDTDLQTFQREQALLDVIGRFGVPKSGSGFALSSRSVGGFSLSEGDMYVGGARFKNPWIMNYHAGYFGTLAAGEKGVVVASCVKTVIDHLREPYLRDPGLGGPDTSGRRQNVTWPRVFRLQDLLTENSMSEAAFISAMEKGLEPRIPGELPRTGRAKFQIDTTAIPADEDCLINEDAGYTGQGNFNYRVEIHTAGPQGVATFKWAREDVRARVVMTDGKRYLEGEPLDDHRAITSGDTVEIKGIRNHARGVAGVLGTITFGLDRSVTFSPEITAAIGTTTDPITITRWDHPHAGNETGILINGPEIALEKGIEIAFSGSHLVGDYWHCAARVVTGDIMWPPRAEDAADGFVPPFNWGPKMAALAMFTRAGNTVSAIRDLRPKFPQLNCLKAEDVLVDDTGCVSAGNTVQDALEDLCSRIDHDVCSITVRPDDLGPITQEIRHDIAALPTLAEALNKIGGLLKSIKVHSENSPDPELFSRRVAINFTAGRYEWPDDLEFAFSDLSALSLRACSGAPVSIFNRNWLRFERCLNVVMNGIQLEFQSADTGLSILGGKSIEMENVLIRRPHNTLDAVVRLGASRRITLRESRVLVDRSRGKDDLRPALHIWTTDGQVLLENVMSNGALIMGAVIPQSASEPVAALLKSAEDGEIHSTFPRVQMHPREFPHQSASGMRITGSKFRAIVPGELMLNDIADWAQDKTDRNFTFTVADSSLSLAMARSIAVPDHPFVKQMRELSDQRVFPGRTAPPVFNLAAKEIPEKARRPFRYIKLIDSEVILGPSILVAETVTVRGTRFSRYGRDVCRAGEYMTASIENDLFGSELNYLAYETQEGNARVRNWRPVCFVVARRSSLSDNLGFPADGRGTKADWPVLLDYSQPGPSLRRNLELMSLLPAALKDRLITLPQKYLESPIK